MSIFFNTKIDIYKNQVSVLQTLIANMSINLCHLWDEECGYDVPIENIEKITSFYTNVGVSGAKQHLYYAKIDDDMKKHSGGGIHDEEIETVYLKVDDYEEFIYDENKAKTPGLMFSFMWFMEKKLSK